MRKSERAGVLKSRSRRRETRGENERKIHCALMQGPRNESCTHFPRPTLRHVLFQLHLKVSHGSPRRSSGSSGGIQLCRQMGLRARAARFERPPLAPPRPRHPRALFYAHIKCVAMAHNQSQGRKALKRPLPSTACRANKGRPSPGRGRPRVRRRQFLGFQKSHVLLPAPSLSLGPSNMEIRPAEHAAPYEWPPHYKPDRLSNLAH